MTRRRTYGLLSIAQRHPRLFARMHERAKDAHHVPLAQECETAASMLRTLRGEPYIWAAVPWRSDRAQRPAADRRTGPRASRFGELTQ